MNKRYYQQGSAHVVVSICLVLALVTALGWVFYQNFIYKDPVKTETSSSTTEKKTDTAKVAKKEACLTVERICFDYPDSWKSDITTETSPLLNAPIDKGTLSSPDKSLSLGIHTGITSIGGMCDPDTEGSMQVVTSEKLGLSGYKADDYRDSALYLVKVVSANREQTGFTPSIYLTNTTKLTKPGKVGACDGIAAPLFPARNIKDTLMNFSTSSAGDRQEKPEPTLDAAKQKLMSDTYTQAFDILKSVRYKN